jgi:hypothetical protein
MERSYAPFTDMEFIEIKNQMATFGSYLPEEKMGWLWSKCTLLRGNTKEPQPCGCKSSGGLWAKAVETLNNYIKENDN